MPAAGLGYPVWRDTQEHPQPDWHEAAARAGAQGQHRRHHHPGYRQGRQPADQPPQDLYPRVHRRAVRGGRGKEGYSAAVLQRSAPAHQRAGDEDHFGRRTV